MHLASTIVNMMVFREVSVKGKIKKNNSKKRAIGLLLSFFCIVQVLVLQQVLQQAHAQASAQSITQPITQTAANTTNADAVQATEYYPLINISELAEYIGAPRRLFVSTDIVGEPVLGSPEAKLVLVEFSDFNCTSCATFHGSSLPQLITNYVDTGKIRFVYRDFVGVGGNISLNASLAGNCLHDQVGTEAYFPLINEFYASSGRKNMNKLIELANQQGLSYMADDLLLCIEDKVFSPEVYGDINAAYEVGIRGTPAFILGYEANDGTVDGLLLLGAAPFDKFAALIDQFLLARDVLGVTTQDAANVSSNN